MVPSLLIETSTTTKGGKEEWKRKEGKQHHTSSSVIDQTMPEGGERWLFPPPLFLIGLFGLSAVEGPAGH